MAVADELVTILGVEVAASTVNKLESFKKAINNVKAVCVSLSAAVSNVAGTAGQFVSGAAEEGSILESLARHTQMSTDALQEWQYAAGQSGVSASAVQGDMVKLNDTFGKTGKSVDQSLMDMAVHMQGLSDSSAMAYGRVQGLSKDTIAVLLQGPDAIAEMRKQAHSLGAVIPAESIKLAADFSRQLGGLEVVMKSLGTQLGIVLMPAMEAIASGFEYFRQVLNSFAGLFDQLIAATKPLLNGLGLMENVTNLVTGALGALMVTFAPLIAKVMLIGAAITGLAILFDDFLTSLRDSDSVIGRLFSAFEERWPDLFVALQKTGQFVRDNLIAGVELAGEHIKTVFSSIINVFGNTFEALTGTAGKFFDSLAERFPTLYEDLKQAGNFIEKFLKEAFELAAKAIQEKIDEILGSLRNIGKVSKDFWGGVGEAGKSLIAGLEEDEGSSALGTGRKFGNVGAQMQVLPAAGQGKTINYTDSSTQNIHVATNDPQQAGEVLANQQSSKAYGLLDTTG